MGNPEPRAPRRQGRAESLPARVREYLSAQAMLPPEDCRVLVACSGGADSVALLHLLCGIEGLSVVCAHFNHGLRGAESDRDEEFVRALCRRLELPCHTGRGDVAAAAEARGRGVEEAARTLRYAFLRETAEAAGCARIATAHTADDNAETVLLHLIRGAGARGLGGIPPVRGALIRPLLTVTRAEILEYLERNALPHVEDSSNESDDYDRNRLRHSVIPALRALNPAAVDHICAAAELLRTDGAWLDSLAEEFLTAYPNGEPLPCAALLALPEPVRGRVLRRFLGDPGREHVLRVLELCRNGREHAALDLPGGRVALERGKLVRDPVPPGTEQPRRELIPGGTLFLPETGRRIESTFTLCSEEIHNSFNTFFFPCEKICGKITVASRAAGDRIRLAGRGCTKEIRRLYADAGLSLRERAERLVLSDGAGPIAVEGFGVAERMTASPGERLLRVTLLRDSTVSD